MNATTGGTITALFLQVWESFGTEILAVAVSGIAAAVTAFLVTTANRLAIKLVNRGVGQ